MGSEDHLIRELVRLLVPTDARASPRLHLQLERIVRRCVSIGSDQSPLGQWVLAEIGKISLTQAAQEDRESVVHEVVNRLWKKLVEQLKHSPGWDDNDDTVIE